MIFLFRWYSENYDRFRDKGYRYTYSFLLPTNETSNFTLGSLEKPIRDLVDVLGNLGSLPPQMLRDFNASYYVPIIDALKESFTKNLPGQVLQALELLDPLLRNREFWQTLRTTVGATSQYLKWVNDKLEELDRSGQTISINKLFPDINEVCSDN